MKVPESVPRFQKLGNENGKAKNNIHNKILHIVDHHRRWTLFGTLIINDVDFLTLNCAFPLSQLIPLPIEITSQQLNPFQANLYLI